MKQVWAIALAMLAIATMSTQGQDKKETPKKKSVPAPQIAPDATERYGKHDRQVIDFWKAESKTPTPLVLFIHGGGWRAGDKSGLGSDAIKRYLANGISVAAINYRFTQHGQEEGVNPPVKAPLDDAARALQVIRSKAKEWNLDKERIGATGGSAGACSSLWLAFHADMADPKSSDPIARESTRLFCAAVSGAQVSLDPKETRAWMPNYTYGAHAFGLTNLDAVMKDRDRLLKWIREYSPIDHVTKDDPPIFMEYPSQKLPPVVGENQTDPTHSAVLGLKLAEKLKEAGVETILVYPGQTHPQYRTSADFLIDRLPRKK
ncbi:MAG: alpha/beta hydrolase [Gemmataceae bacterium]